MGRSDRTRHEMKGLAVEQRKLKGGVPALGVALPDHRNVRATLVDEEGDVSESNSAMAMIDCEARE